MPPVMVTLSRSPRPDADDEQFDPMTFQPDLIADVDADAGPNRCSCAASDDQPY